MSTTNIRIEPFDPGRHDYKDFDCGVGRLDNFLKRWAKQRQAQDMARLFAAFFEGQNKVIGYYSTKMSHVDAGGMPSAPENLLDHTNIPVLLLEHFAVSAAQQSQGIGSALMLDIFKMVCDLSTKTACHAILLDVINDGAPAEFAKRKKFYEKLDFYYLQDAPMGQKNPTLQMYIPVHKIRKIIESKGK